MGEYRRLLKIMFALLALAGTGVDTAQAHPVTGVYAVRDDDRTRLIEIHVAKDGALTGTSRSDNSRIGTYLEGRYENGRAIGTYHDTTTILHIAFLFEFHDDVLTAYLYPGTAGQPPEPRPAPIYLLRQPGTGPTEPVPTPLDVLVATNRNDVVIATGQYGVSLRLGDARRFLELVVLALGEAGIEGSPYMNRRVYVDWLHRAISIFEMSTHYTQQLLADSDAWWPLLEDEWAEARPEARLQVAEDVILLLFETADERGDRAFLDANFESVAGGCDSLSCRAFSLFNGHGLEAAKLRRTCFNLDGCG